MAKKKVARKKTTKKSAIPPKVHSPNPDSPSRIDQMLISNFVALQKVMTNLAVKLDNVANQVSRLVDLFEISAKSLAEKGIEEKTEQKQVKEILGKLNNLEGQNKIIAKGLTMMHDKLPGQNIPSEIMPAPKMPPSMQQNSEVQTQNIKPLPSDQYYRSISDQKRPPMQER